MSSITFDSSQSNAPSFATSSIIGPIRELELNGIKPDISLLPNRSSFPLWLDPFESSMIQQLLDNLITSIPLSGYLSSLADLKSETLRQILAVIEKGATALNFMEDSSSVKNSGIMQIQELSSNDLRLELLRYLSVTNSDQFDSSRWYRPLFTWFSDSPLLNLDYKDNSIISLQGALVPDALSTSNMQLGTLPVLTTQSELRALNNSELKRSASFPTTENRMQPYERKDCRKQNRDSNNSLAKRLGTLLKRTLQKLYERLKKPFN